MSKHACFLISATGEQLDVVVIDEDTDLTALIARTPGAKQVVVAAEGKGGSRSLAFADAKALLQAEDIEAAMAEIRDKR